jgi:hypothetical protein
MNKIAMIFLTMFLALFTEQAYGNACSAKQLSAFHVPNESSCLCGEELKSVQITLPEGLKVFAACGLNWKGNVPIDLKRQKISFDKYSNGDLPRGIILIGGKLELRGRVGYVNGPAANYYFISSNEVGDSRYAISHYLRHFDFDDDVAPKSFKLPITPEVIDCAEADAGIEIHDIRVVIDDSDESGAHPVKYELSNVSKAGECKKKKGH